VAGVASMYFHSLELGADGMDGLMALVLISYFKASGLSHDRFRVRNEAERIAIARSIEQEI